MSEEFNALLKNNTWELVPAHPTQNVIGCKWVFRIKRNPDGSINRYKAQLVAKGFHQRSGLDYSDTFSPVVKMATIQVVLCIAWSRNWKLRQMDINNAFLNGTLTKEVFMFQPPGFIDTTTESYVCKLKKAIYGLKQAPRAWFQALKSFVLSYGFKNSYIDPSFFFQNSSSITYLLVYVDDLILTGNKPSLLDSFVQSLSDKFSLNDLGELNYFLGVEVVPTTIGIFLSQKKYIQDILEKNGMTDAKEVSTPMATTVSLLLSNGIQLSSSTQYCSTVGCLQYLALTRPDIVFIVNKLAQFMHQPTNVHWTAVKRLLWYLKGTISFGLSLNRHSPLALLAYSDADWAGNKDDCTSTTAYVVYLGNNPISWTSRKQKSVSRSSTEAEYRAVAHTTFEVCWLLSLLKEINVQSTVTPTIYCDNIGATYVCANPKLHSKMKHVRIDFHFVWDKVVDGSICVSHVSSKDQLADAITKPLPRQRLLELWCKLGVLARPTNLRGHNGLVQSNRK